MIIDKISKWERSQKESFQKSSGRLQENIVEGKQKGYDFNEFSQDLFSSLYQAKPTLGNATQGTLWAKQSLEIMAGLREYRDLRETGTMGNSFQAGLGTICLASHFAKELPVHQTRNPDIIEKEIKAVESWIEDLKEQNRDTANPLKKASDLRKELAQAKEDWTQPIDEEGLRIALRKALVEAKEEANQLEQETEAFGFGTQQGSDGFKSPELKLALANKIKDNPKLKQIAELAGRFKREARKIQSNKKKPGPDEVSDIEMGDAIERVLPSELLMLGDQTLKIEFMRKFAEKSLLQYKLEEKDRSAKGPIIVCIDNSGSMAGKPEVWSKAIMLAMCRIATDGKRPFAIVHFDSKVQRVDHFEPGKVDPEQLIDSCAFFSNGGTNFEPALAKAFELISKGATKNYKRADIIFITDGEAAMPSELTLKLKKTTGAVIYGICIGTESAVLKAISDDYTSLRDLAADGEVKEKVFSI